ncbi:MAG: hypothetical protein Q9227_000884 [Pyrenula ochraceoflavens]
MSGIETLAFVCNILELITFARETTNLCKGIHQGSHPDEHLRDNASSLANASAQVYAHCQARRPETSDDRALVDIAKKCNIDARALEEEVNFLTAHQRKGTLTATLRTAIRTNWRKARLQRLERSLGSYRSTMETHLLTRVCKRSDAIEAQQCEGFKQLSRNLQHFISRYASDTVKAHDLVRTEFLSTRVHTTQEIRQSESVVKSHVSREIEASTRSITQQLTISVAGIKQKSSPPVKDDQPEQVLTSLKFPAMNERFNHVTNSHTDTFNWVLKSADDQDNTSDQEDSSDQEDFSDQEDTGDQEDTSDKTSRFSRTDKPWDNFMDWLRSDSRIYWISGKIGSGKSTLVKFILSDTRTQAALRSWTPNYPAIVLSYFFWKPGAYLQNSIKGFLCCILHQALSPNEEASRRILSQFDLPFLAGKNSHTDWSVDELRNVTLKALASYPQPFCIFVDGLDEICKEDGAIRLLQLIDEMGKIQNIKICVASRPEHHFQKRFGQCQHLRLQDLTEGDMERYAKKTLEPRLKDLNGLRGDVVSQLVQKAEGVFLWLHLAAHSLIEGLENGDSESELYQRLRNLPSDLSKLYLDMWSRLNENEPVYRAVASRYFNVVIAASKLIAASELIGAIDINPYSDAADFSWPNICTISLVQFVAATEPEIQKVFLDGDRRCGEMDLKKFYAACKKVQKYLKIRCADLLEVVSSNESEPDTEAAPDCSKMRIDYVHRSAYDFLTDTEEGRQLWKNQATTEGRLWLDWVKGYLVEARISTFGYDIFDVLIPLQQISRSYSELKPDINELLRISQKWYSCGDLVYWPNKELQSRFQGHFPSFLALAAVPDLEEFVLETLKTNSDPPATATVVLQNLLCWDFSSGLTSSAIENLLHFLPQLLRLGADPEAKGLVNQGDIWCPPIIEAVGFDSAFSIFLQGVMASFLQFDFGDRTEWLSKVLAVLDSFLECRPSLECHISLIVELNRLRFEEISSDFSWQPAQFTALRPFIGDSSPLSLGPGNSFVMLDVKLWFVLRALIKQCRKILNNKNEILSRVLFKLKRLDSLRATDIAWIEQHFTQLWDHEDQRFFKNKAKSCLRVTSKNNLSDQENCEGPDKKPLETQADFDAGANFFVRVSARHEIETKKYRIVSDKMSRDLAEKVEAWLSGDSPDSVLNRPFDLDDRGSFEPIEKPLETLLVEECGFRDLRNEENKR